MTAFCLNTLEVFFIFSFSIVIFGAIHCSNSEVDSLFGFLDFKYSSYSVVAQRMKEPCLIIFFLPKRMTSVELFT